MLEFTKAEATLLRGILEVQYIIANDTVLDDIFVTRLDVNCIWNYDRIMSSRKRTGERVGVLLVLTRVIVTLANSMMLTLTDKDIGILSNEISIHLLMITDMVGEDTDENTLGDRVDHIVAVNLLIAKYFDQ